MMDIHTMTNPLYFQCADIQKVPQYSRGCRSYQEVLFRCQQFQEMKIDLISVTLPMEKKQHTSIKRS